jgi:hypothetical protein
MACHQDDGIRIVKGIMKKDKARAIYENIPPGVAHVLHFRISTAGSVCPELTHPFIISKDSPIVLEGKTKREVLFHNGMISDWENLYVSYCVAKKKKIEMSKVMSDTRFAAMMVSEVGEEYLPYAGGRFVKMQPDGKTFYWGDFEKEKGVLFSNNGYKWASSWRNYTRNVSHTSARGGNLIYPNDVEMLDYGFGFKGSKSRGY